MIKTIVYDIEIINAIPKGSRIPGITYCQGWHDHQNMGISVICAYTAWNNCYHVFCKDNFGEFQKLVKISDSIIGFNSESFDDCVCKANGLSVKTSYDILREIYKAIGLEPYPEYFNSKYKGYGLDALCKANGIEGKTGHGAYAPVLWQQKKYGEVIDYCLHDVKMTKDLLHIIEVKKQLVDPTTEKSFAINIPYKPVETES